MIVLTRLNGKPFSLNAFLIEQIEALPDTTITLVTGKKIIVKESEEEVREKIVALYRTIGLVFAPQMHKEDDACSKAKS
ncbi:flagellar FlbD family protein [Tuberibacillus calidus]|jgi:flagellar protein FlbD|uniref:flagellar FlbD family protein n=1 Tax=Tuberibacillus calidus TaxID=340097 RepID=UPI0004068F63|nr:flagellar FlbD family protein [Tuberibacillus calidus]